MNNVVFFHEKFVIMNLGDKMEKLNQLTSLLAKDLPIEEILRELNCNRQQLLEYLKKLKISVDNYNQSCKVLTKSNLYIELHLQDKDKLTTYTIPLLLEDNC